MFNCRRIQRRTQSWLHEQDVLLLCRDRELQGTADGMGSAGWWVARLWVWGWSRCLCCEPLARCRGDGEHRRKLWVRCAGRAEEGEFAEEKMTAGL